VDCGGRENGVLNCIPPSDSNRGTGGVLVVDNDDNERELFLLCPKCVLLRQSQPERISYPCAAVVGASSRYGVFSFYVCFELLLQFVHLLFLYIIKYCQVIHLSKLLE